MEKKIHHIPQTRFFFRVSQRIFCTVFPNPHLPGGGSPPSRAHHVISPPDRIPALQGCWWIWAWQPMPWRWELYLGPWGRSTLVWDATRETVRGVWSKCGEFFSLFLDKGLDFFFGNPRDLVFIYIFLRISYIQWVWRNQPNMYFRVWWGENSSKKWGPEKFRYCFPAWRK